MPPSENTGRQQPGRRFPKGVSGNPRGRPKGARNRATVTAELLLDGEAAALTRKAIEMAKSGDITALRLCLERILPPRRSRAVVIDLPAVRTAKDVLEAVTAVLSAMAAGELAPDDAMAVVTMLDKQIKTVEVVEIEARLVALEERANAQG